MKISEVIKKLQEIKNKHGDCDVYRVFDSGEILNFFSMSDSDIVFRENCVEILTYEM